MDSIKINPAYETEDFKVKFAETMAGKSDTSLPFPHFTLANFVEDGGSLKVVLSELKQMSWNHKDNDLLSLEQTEDLGNLKAEAFPNLVKYREWVKAELKPWVERMSGVALTEQVDLTGSLYTNTDYLLAHDDQLEGRKFAFILYLSDMAPGDGGLLQLFNSDEDNCPWTVATEVRPEFNRFSMFLVSPKSWHMVSEVKKEGAMRYSINGWFHASDVQLTIPPTIQSYIYDRPHMDVELAEVTEWFNEGYVSELNHAGMRKQFEGESALELPNILKAEKYTELLAALKECPFSKPGPPHRRQVWFLDEFKLEPSNKVAVLLRIFRSAAVGVLLSQWTGLAINECSNNNQDDSGVTPAKKPRVDPATVVPTTVDPATAPSKINYENVRFSVGLYRVEAGSFTMVDDEKAGMCEKVGYQLHTALFILPNEWKEEEGGFVSFVAKDEEDEVVRVLPESNKLSMVFTEPDVCSFIKYVNNRAADRHYYMLSCSVLGFELSDEVSEQSTQSSESDSD